MYSQVISNYFRSKAENQKNDIIEAVIYIYRYCHEMMFRQLWKRSGAGGKPLEIVSTVLYSYKLIKDETGF